MKGVGLGGNRPGAGRKPKAAEPSQPGGAVAALRKTEDPRAFLVALMNDSMADLKLRADAAKALMPFEHAKKGEGGKKDARNEAAKQVASRFSPAAPPKLVAAAGRKV
jgi:phage terminase small subunit